MPAHGACHPRPVADAPVGALADGAVVAKAWLVELVAAADLGDAARVPVAEVAREGPALCAALVAALGTDAALPRLAELAPGAGRLAGASDPAGAVEAAEALRRAAWACLAAELPHGGHAPATDLALRLAHVCALVAAAAASSALPGRSTDDLVPLIQRRLRDEETLAVLLVEVDDLDRLLAAGVDEDVERAGRAVGEALGAEHELVAERPGRWWVLAPAAGAARLAEDVADAVAGNAGHRGAPLTVSVGVALGPEDGATATELLARAEEGAFAARAAGVRLAPST